MYGALIARMLQSSLATRFYWSIGRGRCGVEVVGEIRQTDLLRYGTVQHAADPSDRLRRLTAAMDAGSKWMEVVRSIRYSSPKTPRLRLLTYYGSTSGMREVNPTVNRTTNDG